MVDLPAPLCPTRAVIFLPEKIKLIEFKIFFCVFGYLKFTFSNLIVPSFKFKSFALFFSLISGMSSIIGKTLTAPEIPC